MKNIINELIEKTRHKEITWYDANSGYSFGFRTKLNGDNYVIEKYPIRKGLYRNYIEIEYSIFSLNKLWNTIVEGLR